MLMELGYASSTTTAAVDIFHSRGTYPWPAKYGTNESGSLAIALEWLAPLCAREKPWTIGKDSPLDNEGKSLPALPTLAATFSARPKLSPNAQRSTLFAGPLCVLLYRVAAQAFPANRTRYLEVASKAKDAVEGAICFGFTCTTWADLTWPTD